MNKDTNTAELLGGPYSGRLVRQLDSFLTVKHEGKPGVYKLAYCRRTGRDFYLWVGYNNPIILNGYTLDFGG